MRKIPFASCALALLVSGAPAQDPDAKRLDELEARVRFRLGDDGQVLFAPEPATGDVDTFVPVMESDVGMSFAFIGLFGYLSFLAGGPTDLASLSDAPRFFERLGGEDAMVLQAIAADATDRPTVLKKLLALRAVESRGLKAAFPLVDRVAADEDADPIVRRAAIEARALLNGRARPALDVELPALDSILARVPDDAHFVLRTDAYRMPPVRRLGAWARTAARTAARTHALEMPQFYDDRAYLDGLRIAEAAGVLPYDLARQFGNHRIDRVVLAMRLPDGVMAGVPSFWIHLDGRFDVEPVRAGLETAGVPFEVDGTTVVVPLPDGYAIRVGPRVVLLGSDAFAAPVRDAAPDALRDALGGDAQLALWTSPDAPFPDEVRRLRPQWLQLHVPPGGKGELRLTGAWSDPTGAAAFRGVLASAPGLLERTAGDLTTLEPVLDALDALEIDVERERMEARMPIPVVDVGAVLRELIESGLVR